MFEFAICVQVIEMIVSPRGVFLPVSFGGKTKSPFFEEGLVLSVTAVDEERLQDLT